jgi:heat shock protein HslJ
MNYSLTAIVALFALLAIGCQSKEKETAPVDSMPSPVTSHVSLLDTRWELVELNGKPVISIAPDKAADAMFSSKDGRVAGMASVNRYFGTFTVDGNSLTIKPGGMTRMAGPEPLMKQEQEYSKALEATKSYRISGDSLELLDGATVVAKFARQ